ncbi:hypothetical protein [Alienimonas sp. DA493]|uniref:hypothetical protein n=1 Tax=Alienimonas sp. DA493 TaxID=3373605 RepID=UPI00375483EA
MPAKPAGPTPEEIYAAYPKKAGKGQALKAIKSALKRKDGADLLASVREFAEAVDGADKQFVPYPATWFNGDRWDDDRDVWRRMGRDGDHGKQEKAAERAAHGELATQAWAEVRKVFRVPMEDREAYRAAAAACPKDIRAIVEALGGFQKLKNTRDGFGEVNFRRAWEESLDARDGLNRKRAEEQRRLLGDGVPLPKLGLPPPG